MKLRRKGFSIAVLAAALMLIGLWKIPAEAATDVEYNYPCGESESILLEGGFGISETMNANYFEDDQVKSVSVDIISVTSSDPSIVEIKTPAEDQGNICDVWGAQEGSAVITIEYKTVDGGTATYQSTIWVVRKFYQFECKPQALTQEIGDTVNLLDLGMDELYLFDYDDQPDIRSKVNVDGNSYRYSLQYDSDCWKETGATKGNSVPTLERIGVSDNFLFLTAEKYNKDDNAWNAVATVEIYCEGLQYSVNWVEDSLNWYLYEDEVHTAYLDASELPSSAVVEFKVGTYDFESDTFTAFTDQTGLFDVVNDSNGTGVKLYGEKIKAYKSEMKSEGCFDVYASAAVNGVQVWNGAWGEIELRENREDYELGYEDGMTLITDQIAAQGTRMTVHVYNKDNPDGTEVTTYITDMKVTGTADVVSVELFQYEDEDVYEVHGLKAGETELTVTYEKLDGSTDSYVIPVSVTDEALELCVDAGNGYSGVLPGESYTLTAGVQKISYDAEAGVIIENLEGVTYKWSLMDEDIADYVTLLSNGNVLTVKVKENAEIGVWIGIVVEASYNGEVIGTSAEGFSVDGIVFTTGSHVVEAGKSMELYKLAPNMVIDWVKSTDTSIATVTADGTVTGVAPGVVSIEGEANPAGSEDGNGGWDFSIDVTVYQVSAEDAAVKEATAALIKDVMEDMFAVVESGKVSMDTAWDLMDAVMEGKLIEADLVVTELTDEEVAERLSDTKAVFEEKAAESLKSLKEMKYLDIFVLLRADGVEIGTLNKLENKATITVDIPEEWDLSLGTVIVIHEHSGEIELIEPDSIEDRTVTFKSDSFSTYALAYGEAKEASDSGSGSHSSSSSSSSSKTTAGTAAAKTGDAAPVSILTMVSAAALATVIGVLVFGRKRRNY